MAGRTVIGDVFQLAEVPERPHVHGLSMVEYSFSDLADGEDLVAGIIEHPLLGNLRAADLLAFPAPDA